MTDLQDWSGRSYKNLRAERQAEKRLQAVTDE